MLSHDLKDKVPVSQDAFKFSWSDHISDWNQNPFPSFFHQGLHTLVDRITQSSCNKSFTFLWIYVFRESLLLGTQSLYETFSYDSPSQIAITMPL